MGFPVLAQDARPPKGYSLAQQRMSLSDGVPLPVEVEKPGSEFFTGWVMQLIPIRGLLFQFIEEPFLVRGREKGANGFAGERGAVVRERLQWLNA